MKRFIYILFIIQVTVGNLSAQGIRDSVFRIDEVAIKARQIFDKTDAGMKQSEVDSMVFAQKINQSLSAVLSENTPVFIKNHGRGALASASFRGTAPSHTQVSWNGININTPMAGMVDFSLIPVYVADAIKLKHGTASISDGGGGLGGSIQINNTVDWDNEFKLSYLQAFGSYGTFDEFLKLNIGNSNFQYKSRLYHNYSKNNYTFTNHAVGGINPETGAIIYPLDTNKNADYGKFGVLQEFYYRPDLYNSFSLQYWGQNAERTLPRATSYEGPDNSNLNRQQDIDHKIVARWQHLTEKSKLKLLSGFANKKLDYYLKNQIYGLGQIPVIYSQSTQQSIFNNLKYEYETAQNLSIVGKAEMNRHWVNSQDTVQKTGYTQNRTEYGLFLSLRKEIGNRLNINTMLRQQASGGQILPLIPFLGFDFALNSQKNWILKGNLARNYRHPTLNELYWQPGGNPELKPEKGRSYELGTEYQYARKKTQVTTEITLFYSNITDWIIWIPGYKAYWEPQNIQKVRTKGVEMSGRLKKHWELLQIELSGTYNYNSSVNLDQTGRWGDSSYGKQLVYTPVHSGNLMLNTQWRGYFITYQYNAYSERFTTTSNDVSRRDWLYPYFMNNLMFGKGFNKKSNQFRVEFQIFNLLNENYHSILYRPMPGRNYSLLLTYKFL